MLRKTAHLEIVVSFPHQEIYGDSRTTFWKQLGMSDSYPIDPVHADERLVGQFGNRLKQSLGEFILGDALDSVSGEHLGSIRLNLGAIDHQIKLLKSVYFEVTHTQYNSLHIFLKLFGVSELSELFSGDIEMLRAFLNQYTPRIIGRSSGIDVRPDLQIDIPHLYNLLECGWLQDETSLHNQMPVSSSPTKVERDARWVWTMTNSSLVVPVLLGMAILLYGCDSVSQDRKLYITGLNQILSQGHTSIQQENASEITKLKGDLVKVKDENELLRQQVESLTRMILEQATSNQKIKE